MPFKTVMEKFSDGQFTWMEPKRIWVDPTPEEQEAEAAALAADEATRSDLVKKMTKLTEDMRAALDHRQDPK